MQLLCAIVLIAIYLVPSNHAQSRRKHIDGLLQEAGIERKQFSTRGSRNGKFTYTNLDDVDGLIWFFELLRRDNLNQYLQNEENILQSQRARGRLQPLIPSSQSFPCDLNYTRSNTTPTSVNHLRPGDIDIIGAMGDSLTAGDGILADSLRQESAEFRGVSFLGGGLKDWRTYLTIPNILKVYNPNLYGYAIGHAITSDKPSRLSVGEAAASSQDMPYQALVLIKRMKRDSNVDMAKHWKLINLLVGEIDMCVDMCHYDDREKYLVNFRQNIYKTLEILKTHVPRLLVNLLASVNVQKIFANQANIPLVCRAVQGFACNCIVNNRVDAEGQKKNYRTIRLMQGIAEELAALPEFQTKDFAVVYRPFTGNFDLNKTEDGSTDRRLLAPDCFHLSQLGNAALAQALWNEMVVARDEAGTAWLQYPFESYECPTEEMPYITTYKNSLENKKNRKRK